jgi:hypothetical protein
MTTKDDTKMIHLDPSSVGVGDLLTEVSRAYLYTGNPSAFVQRILEGVGKYMDISSKSIGVEDQTVINNLYVGLVGLRERLKKVEDILASERPRD